MSRSPLRPREASHDDAGFSAGPEELTAYTELAPDRVDALRDLMLFG